MIDSLRLHWPARKLEWIMAGILTSWGFYVLTHPEIFTQPETRYIFQGLLKISDWFTPYPSLAWGWVGLILGIGRGIALLVNGAWTRTPFVRLVTSFASMFVFTQIIIGLWDSGVPNPSLVIYPWFVIADLSSSYRAAVDFVYAQKQREALKEARDARKYVASFTS